MQPSQIQNIITKHTTELTRSAIKINEHNHQIEELTLIFPDTKINPHSCISPILEDIDQLTRDDNYGDMTECTIQYTTFHEEPNDDNLYIAITMTFNIDS